MLLKSEPVPVTEEYLLNRMAILVAEATSETRDAIPEEEDLEVANEVMKVLLEHIKLKVLLEHIKDI